MGGNHIANAPEQNVANRQLEVRCRGVVKRVTHLAFDFQLQVGKMFIVDNDADDVDHVDGAPISIGSAGPSASVRCVRIASEMCSY